MYVCTHVGVGTLPITAMCQSDLIMSQRTVLDDGFVLTGDNGQLGATGTIGATTPMIGLTRKLEGGDFLGVDKNQGN